jgi:hypothetical protein
MPEAAPMQKMIDCCKHFRVKTWIAAIFERSYAWTFAEKYGQKTPGRLRKVAN